LLVGLVMASSLLADIGLRHAAEFARRRKPLESLFPQQLEAATDPCRFKAIITPRRGGKSNTILRRFAELGLMYPGSKFPYIMLTRGQSKNVAWPELKSINKREKLGCVFNETDLRATLPGGSTIELYGADKPGWMEVMRGAKNRAAAIDEAQGFTIRLSDMIYQVLRPTLIDQMGELFLGGTPGIVKTGIFYHVTQNTGKYHGWKVFNWSTADNPHVRKQYLAELEQIRKEHPDVDILTIPWVRREYFGEWIIDDANNVYSFSPERNGVYQWEKQPGDEYVCGIDFGWHDRTAWIVGAYNPTKSGDFTVLESSRYPKMLIDDVAKEVKALEEQYPGIMFVADYSRRQLLEELSSRADVYIQPAEKAEKKDFIELVNRDLLKGRIKILHPGKSRLAEEMTDLKWIERPSGKVEETPAQPTDCCDSFLYAYRRAWHYTHQAPEEKPRPGTRAYEEARMDQHFKETIKKHSDDQGDWWDRG
jgi:hypothetical protein